MTVPKLPVVEAIDRIRHGRMVIVVDGPDREDEGDLTMAAQLVTRESIRFMIREAGGLICVPCVGTRLDDLELEPMVPAPPNGTCAAFTVSVDHREAGSGISAPDRAMTIRALADPSSRPGHFIRPGHVFPLRAREGGVLERPGHTEAGIDLVRLAGLQPCAVICEVLNDDGSVARLPDLERFGARHDIPIVTIEDLIAHRRRTSDGSLSPSGIAHRTTG